MNWLINFFKSLFGAVVSPQFVIKEACNRTFMAKPDLAPKVLQVVASSIAMIQNQTVTTLSALNDFVSRQINASKFTPEELTLVQVLVGSVQQQIETIPSAPVQNLDQALLVLGWVRESAAIYSAKK